MYCVIEPKQYRLVELSLKADELDSQKILHFDLKTSYFMNK